MESNIEHIRSHFAKIRGNRVISVRYFTMEHVQQNAFDMAIEIIQARGENPDHDILLDLSAGRVAIKLALSRAGEIVYDYFEIKVDRPRIVCALRPEEYPEVISYPVKRLPLPSKRDQMLLKYVSRNGKRTQTRIAREIGWKNQGEVSKALGRLEEADYVDRSRQTITREGEDVLRFIRGIGNK